MQYGKWHEFLVDSAGNVGGDLRLETNGDAVDRTIAAVLDSLCALCANCGVYRFNYSKSRGVSRGGAAKGVGGAPLWVFGLAHQATLDWFVCWDVGVLVTAGNGFVAYRNAMGL